MQAGYQQQGSRYVRKVVVYASLTGGNDYDRQQIEGYRYYEIPQVRLETDLSDEMLTRLTGEGIRMQLDRAVEEITEKRNEIFGEHVGWAPEMVSKPDPNRSIGRNLRYEGSGEMGRIMRPFLDHQLKESRGLSMATGPVYNLPIWGGLPTGSSAGGHRGHHE